MGKGSRFAAGLRITACLATGLVAVVVAISWRDSGAAMLLVAGVPTLAAAVVLILTVRGHRALATTWLAAVVVLAWAVLTGLGTGFFFAAPGVLLLVAAIASIPPARMSRPSEG